MPVQWEYTRKGMESQMSTWSPCGPTLCQSMDLENPARTIMVQGSGYSAYMNSALKFQLVGVIDSCVLHYKHCRDKFDDLVFRQCMHIGLSLKATIKTGKLWHIQVSSAMSGNVLMPDVEMDCNTRISTAKKIIIEKLIECNKATRSTVLNFVEPAENMGVKKMSTILKAKDTHQKVIKTIKK